MPVYFKSPARGSLCIKIDPVSPMKSNLLMYCAKERLTFELCKFLHNEEVISLGKTALEQQIAEKDTIRVMEQF